MNRWTILVLLLLAAGCAGGSPNGEDVSWAFQAGGPGTDLGAGVASFEDSTGVTVGAFDDSITLGPGQPGEAVLTSLGGDDLHTSMIAL